MKMRESIENMREKCRQSTITHEFCYLNTSQYSSCNNSDRLKYKRKKYEYEEEEKRVSELWSSFVLPRLFSSFFFSSLFSLSHFYFNIFCFVDFIQYKSDKFIYSRLISFKFQYIQQTYDVYNIKSAAKLSEKSSTEYVRDCESWKIQLNSTQFFLLNDISKDGSWQESNNILTRGLSCNVRKN